ncbi:MAG: dienelactone hydrolase family protein [Acidovorax sp.]|nr:dienelactone hydrolase family protein [Acidovorax sp.]
MSFQNVLIDTPDGFRLPALFVPCAQEQGRPLVLIQEIFGINSAMRAAAQDWAAQGFDVLCPDLFARQQSNVSLDPREPGQFQAGVQLMMGMKPELALQDLEAARQWLAQRQPGQGVAALGYCLGGRLAVQMALHTPVAAAVSYYGVGLEELLPETPQPIAPTLLHIAENDAFVPTPAREAILARAAALKGVEAHVYPGCDHAFARPDGEHHDAGATAQALKRTLAFLHA